MARAAMRCRMRAIANMDLYEFEAVYRQPTPLRPVESMKPENYDHDPEVARLMGRASRVGWGGIFHVDSGIIGQLLTAEEEACAKAFCEG